jgi:hypothetical protein
MQKPVIGSAQFVMTAGRAKRPAAELAHIIAESHAGSIRTVRVRSRSHYDVVALAGAV